jgi:hypothetical protein
MNLFFHIIIHILLTILSGYFIWQLWKKSIAAFLSVIFGGVLIDMDHLIDYFIAFGWSFRLDYFISGYQFLKSNKMYVLLHGWEYVMILAILVVIIKSKVVKSICLALALGIFLHLTVDVVANNMAFKTYFTIYRMKNNFAVEKLVSKEHYQEHLQKKRLYLH